ncbi:phosphatidylinositol-glycan biosynthesis class X protein [Hyaena hyaena]|uniref:phosphatidylinositol-glycan biosynthesis class X protein n=1 Tax=Hyaena hyaena TaxID=95912 RepID=UPI00192331AD|nr:phosphatidylinositol-glycan biosynthesis class X protein [Hyaena hyaena]
MSKNLQNLALQEESTATVPADVNFPAGGPNPQVPVSAGGDRELPGPARKTASRGRGLEAGPGRRSQSNRPGSGHGACAAPCPASDRTARGGRRGSEYADSAAASSDAGTFSGSTAARVTESSVSVTNSVAARSRSGVRRAKAPLSASSSVRVSSARALGSAFSSVLAARAVGVRAVAWLLLWEAAGLTSTPATTFSAAPTDTGIRAICSEIILRQEVLKDGFHRDLLIKVKFGESIEDLQTCRLLIKQYIPAGLFVDPYELASLQERNITEAVMVSENFNIEAPNYLSEESEVLIYARQDSQCIDCFQAFLPVHYRYHRPHSKDGETFIVVNNPDLLMYCDQEFPILKCWAQSKVAAPCALKNKDICQWNNMKYKSVYKNVTLQVPVGLTIHTSLVCSVTLLITVLCSTLILVAVFKYGHFSL